MLGLGPVGQAICSAPWVYVSLPAITVTPGGGAVNATTSVTVHGVGTQWTVTTPTLTIAGGAGTPTLTNPVIVDDFTITADLYSGTVPANLTITDPSTDLTTIFSTLTGTLSRMTITLGMGI